MNQNTMNSMLLGWVMLVTTVPLQARELEISGPNEQVRLGLKTDSDGHLMYAVHSAGQTRLAWAKAGIVVDGRDLGAKVEIGEPTKRSISETFAWRGNKTLATNHCEVAKIPLAPRPAAEDGCWRSAYSMTARHSATESPVRVKAE